MAVTLSDAELSAGMMLTGAVGDVLDTPPEPVLGRIQRFKVSRDCNHKRAHSNGTRGRTERVRDQAMSNFLVQPTTGGPNVGLRQRLGQFGLWHGRCRLDTTSGQRRSFDPPLEGPFALAWGELDLEWAGRMLTWGDEDEV